MKLHDKKGFAYVAIILVLAVGSALGWGAWEWRKAGQPNTPKAVAEARAATLEAQARVGELKAANDRADAALKEFQLSNTQLQGAVAEDALGARLALEAAPKPTVPDLVAYGFLGDAQKLLPAVPPATELRLQATVTQLLKANADQAGQITDLKTAAVRATADYAALQASHAATLGAFGDAKTALATTQLAKDQAVAAAKTATDIAGQNARQIEVVHQSWLERFRHWAMGLGIFGVVLLVLVPLVASVFPELLPVIKTFTTPILGLWHKVENDIQEELKELAAKHQGALAAEQAAHAATQSALLVAHSTIAALAAPPVAPVAPPVATAPPPVATTPPAAQH